MDEAHDRPAQDGFGRTVDLLDGQLGGVLVGWAELGQRPRIVEERADRRDRGRVLGDRPCERGSK